MSQPNFKFQNIDEYILKFPPKTQLLLQKIRQTINEAAPNSTETISYNMPAFRQNEILIYFAAYKSHIGIYPTSGPLEFFKNELKHYKCGRGSIQLPLDQEIPTKLIKQLVTFRLKEIETKTKVKDNHSK
jgi:uncharacterized protein YdhG (YjbR/CyaY superfamily)